MTNHAKLNYPQGVMDGRGGSSVGYESPQITDYGTLIDITADGAVMAHVGLGNGFALAQGGSLPQTPQSGGGGLTPTSGQGDVLGDSGGGGDGGSGGDGPGNGDGNGLAGSPGGNAGGSGSGGGGGGGGGGSLPFTGFAAAALGAVGAGLSAAGLAIRERLRRRD